MNKIWFFFPFLLLAKEDFISDFEYGQMLYENPRGISCAACHAKNGEGKKIVSYQEQNETIVIRGVDIRSHTLDEIEAIVARNHPVMPKYYLTYEEVEAIYSYLQEMNEREGYAPSVNSEQNTTKQAL
ncbi:MAG: cytochrome c [Campylobacterota bacterium]|nr:cytochrome c [Campylobacterota bacterium]